VIIPPEGYLSMLREVTAKHGILLIFDEVITGFGRLGESFAAKRFGVTPDLISIAKGMTNGAAPMGGVISRSDIYDAFIENSKSGIEFAHGYTYSASPIACAAGLAALDIYEKEGLFTRARELEQYFEDKLHSFKEFGIVKDIRNFGLVGAIELKSIPGQEGARGYELFKRGFFEHDILVRATKDTIAFAPPLVTTKEELDMMFERFTNLLKSYQTK
jgi:beta-alanine--pyruvate transaminase